MSLLKFNNGNWSLKWTNLSYTYEHSMFAYRSYLIVGDYDGDGKDELLGNGPLPGGWTTLFKYNSNINDWVWQWADGGNASNHPIRQYKSKMYAIDFTGDGKDEILGCDLTTNGFTKEIRWDNIANNFVIQGWSDNSTHAIRQYRDNFVTGNFNGFGGTELLGLKSWATIFEFKNGDWRWNWSTGSSGSFGGWGYPFNNSDKTVIGNIDNDNNDEIVILQTGATASYATSFDFSALASQWDWHWNWSTYNSNSAIPFIDDWSIADGSGSDTKYYSVKPLLTEPKQILAIRKYGCNNSYFASMYKRNNIYGNYKIQSKNNIEDLNNEENVIVYPNPANDVIHIKINDDTQLNNISIIDLQGRLLFELINHEPKEITVNIANFTKGLYLLKVNNKNFNSVKKIIID